MCSKQKKMLQNSYIKIKNILQILDLCYNSKESEGGSLPVLEKNGHKMLYPIYILEHGK